MSILLLIVLSALTSSVAEAQIILQSGSFQTLTSANTTASGGSTCSDPGGGVGVAVASSSCIDLDLNTAGASAQSIVLVDTRGANFSLTAASAGAAVVGQPGPFAAQANGSGSASALRNWFMSNDTHYSLAVSTTTDFGGGGLASAFVSFSGGGAASGLLASGTYALNANLTTTSGANETGPVTAASSASASVRLTFAEAASPTLILGTVLAGGVGQAGLLVEALDGTTLIDSALTGDDGSYLLPAVTASVTLRISDPSGGFESIESALLAPPATFDAGLVPAPAVPALDPWLLGILVLIMISVLWVTHRRPIAQNP